MLQGDPWRGAAAGAATSLLVAWLLSQPHQAAADRLAAHYLLPYLSDSPPSSPLSSAWAHEAILLKRTEACNRGQVTVEFCNLFQILGFWRDAGTVCAESKN